jgi:hypothetical protein
MYHVQWNLCSSFWKGPWKIHDEFRKIIVAGVIYMGHVQPSEKVNGTCMKTMHARKTDRGFTVIQW